MRQQISMTKEQYEDFLKQQEGFNREWMAKHNMTPAQPTKTTPTFAGYENLDPNVPLPQGPPYYGYTKNEYTNMAKQGILPKGLPTTPTQPTTGQPTPLPPSQWQPPTTGQPITEQPVTGMIQPNFQYQPTKPPMPTGQPTGIMQRPSSGFDIGSSAHRLWDKTLGRTSLPSNTFARNRFSGMTTGWDNPYYRNLFKKSR